MKYVFRFRAPGGRKITIDIEAKSNKTAEWLLRGEIARRWAGRNLRRETPSLFPKPEHKL